jgi:ABC-type transporter Mla MlaB component
MPVAFDQSNSPSRISLEGEINIRCAAELKEFLLQALTREGALHIELSTATEVDITALQLLWTAQREAREAGKEFLLNGPISETVAAAIKHSGLQFAENVA